jgi:hypothetical protein
MVDREIYIVCNRDDVGSIDTLHEAWENYAKALSRTEYIATLDARDTRKNVPSKTTRVHNAREGYYLVQKSTVMVPGCEPKWVTLRVYMVHKLQLKGTVVERLANLVADGEA